MLFGNLPPRLPARPASRGALLGMNYQNMPSSQNIEIGGPDDDYSAQMKRVSYNSELDPDSGYSPSAIGGQPAMGGFNSNPIDPWVTPLYQANQQYQKDNSYTPSFNQSWQPSAAAIRRAPAPYRPSAYGPNLPSRAVYDPAWLGPITPGQPGWAPPSSSTGQSGSPVSAGSSGIGNSLMQLLGMQ